MNRSVFEGIRWSRRLGPQVAAVVMTAIATVAIAGELRLPGPGDDVVAGQFVVILGDAPPAGVLAADGYPPPAKPATAGEIASMVKEVKTVYGLDAEPVGRGSSSLVVTWPEAVDANEVAAQTADLEAIAASPGVRVVEPVYRYHLDGYVPSDPDVDRLWYFTNTRAQDAFRVASTGNPAVTVAVIDTGTRTAHPDLSAALHPDSYNFVQNNTSVDPDWGQLSGGGFGWQDHGTHCAGTILTTWNNGVGLAGMCSNARLLTCKIFDGNGSTTTTRISQAIRHAADRGARVANCSFSGPGFSQEIVDAIVHARSRGMILVCSAGNLASDNDAAPRYPGSYNYDNIIAVAATDQADDLAGFSNYGATRVHLGAPGVSIWSTTVSGTNTVNTPVTAGSSYGYKNGTSMATPVVCGALAELLSRSPSLTYTQLRTRLLNSTRSVPGLAGRCTTGGVLDVRELLQDTNRSPVVANLTPVRLECTGTQQTATFETTVYDQDGQFVDVTWRVNGVTITKTSVDNVVHAMASPGTGHTFNYTIPGKGVYTIQVIANDGTHTTTRSAELVLEDTTAPILIVAPDIIVPTDPGQAFATNVMYDPLPTVEDACDDDLILIPQPKDRYDVGLNLLHWVALDQSGNSTAFTQNVIVEDREAPTAEPLAPITRRVDRGEPFATITLTNPVSYDNVGVTSITRSGPANGRFPAGTSNVTWTISDAAGNSTSIQQTVTVQNAVPVASAGAPQQTRLTAENRGRIRLDGRQSRDDDDHDLFYTWSAQGVTFDDPHAAQPTGAFAAGLTVVTLSVTDECGATATAFTTVAVDPGRIVESRPLAPVIDTYVYYGYLYAASGYLQSPWNGWHYYAYACSLYSYYYNDWARSVPITHESDIGPGLANYQVLRYYQYAYSYYAYAYGSFGLSLGYETNAYYGFVYNYYAYAYAIYDL